MKKRIFILALCLILALCSMLMLASCGDEETESSSETSSESSSESACAHTWGDWAQTTAPTCLQEGERSRSCSLCSETQTEKVAKTAHTYQAGEWTWSADNTSATLSLVCSASGTEHTAIANAVIAQSALTAATCGVAGSKTLVATLEFDGKTYTGTKTVEIPATGAHTYKNDGKCSVCDAPCAHQNETKTVRLEDLGICRGIARYDECTICKYQQIDEEYFAYTCDIDGQGPNATCTICSAVYEIDSETVTSGCTSRYVSVVSVKKGDTYVVKDAVTDVVYDEHRYETVFFDAREYGSTCYPYVKLERCERCGFNELDKFQSFCDGGATPTASKTTIDGIEHSIVTIDCDDCPLKSVLDTYYTQDGCLKIEHKSLKIYKDDELVLDASSEEVTDDFEHDFEMSYALVGGAVTCEDGVMCVGKCKNCDYDYATVNYWHVDAEVEEIDFSEYAGFCGGGVRVEYCNLCGKTASVYDNIYCDSHITSGLDVNESTGVTTRTEETTCENCDIRIIKATTKTPVGTCKTNDVIETKIYYGSTLLYEGENVEESTNHKGLSYKTELLEGSTTCEDGVKLTVNCSGCGYSETAIEYDHYELNQTIYTLADYEAGLEGFAQKTTCACGAEVGAFMDSDVMSQFTPALPTVEDIEGGQRVTMVYTSPEGKIVITLVMEDYEIGCTVYENITVTVEANSILIIDRADGGSSQYVSHSDKEELAVKLAGETCDDGVYIFEECKTCGDLIVSVRDWCVDNVIYQFDATTEDVCDYHEFTLRSCPCGDYYSLYYDEGYLTPVAIEGGVAYRCDFCDYKIEKTVKITKDVCDVTTTTTTRLLVGDSEKFSDSTVTVSQEHTNTVTASRVDGKIAVTSTCSVCSMALSQKIDTVTTSLQPDGSTYATYTVIPTKSGTYTLISAIGYDTYATLYEVSASGKLTKIGDDDDGGYNANFALTAELEAGKIYAYIVGDYYMRDIITFPVVLVDGRIEECNNCGIDNHSIFAYKTETESCESGVYEISYCSSCALITSINEMTTHEEQAIVQEIHLDEYCGGEIRIESCACGKYKRVESNAYCAFDYDATSETIDGEEVYTEIGTCQNCDFSYTKVYTLKEEGCYVYEEATYTATGTDGAEIVKVTDIYACVGENHVWEYEYTALGQNCAEDGIVETRTCSVCQKVEESEYYAHLMAIDKFTESMVNEDICDGHSFHIRTCLCGAEKRIERDDGLLHSSDEDGDIYICDGCDLKFSVKMKDTDDSECIANFKTECVISFGATELYSITFDEYVSEEHAYTMTASTQDASTIIAACANCPKTFETKIYSGALVPMTWQGIDDYYAYDVVFTPTVSGYYTAYAVEGFDTCATLLDNQGEIIAGDDDSGVESNFVIVYYLEAGQSYTFRVSEYGGANENSGGTIDFFIAQAELDISDCYHVSSEEVEVGDIKYTYCAVCGHISDEIETE